MPEQEDSGFKVTDRRKYNPDGSLRDSTDSPAPPAVAEAQSAPVAAGPEAAPETPPASGESAPNNIVSFPTDTASKQTEPAPRRVENTSETSPGGPASAADKAAAKQAENDYNRTRGPAAPGLPEASFLSLVNMLAVEAAMHLGLLRTAGEEPPQIDLESGRHLIDMLGMLQSKTRGNLTTEEDELLENVLADLRMQFVAISRRR